MTRLVSLTRDELLARRDDILRRHRTSLDDLARRAERFELAGDEWAAWDDLQEIAFLLRDYPAGGRGEQCGLCRKTAGKIRLGKQGLHLGPLVVRDFLVVSTDRDVPDAVQQRRLVAKSAVHRLHGDSGRSCSEPSSSMSTRSLKKHSSPVIREASEIGSE